MKILFACGGTAGHINPAIAVAKSIQKKKANTQVLFAGNPNGMEQVLVPKQGYDFAPIEIQGFRRQINLTNIAHNAKSLCLLTNATKKARKIIENFSPDVVMGTGGYVSGPILRAAAKMGIPTLTHEQNAYPGITTKLLVKYVDKVLLAVEEAKEHLPKSDKYTVVGNPIREDILNVDREYARDKLNVDNRMCILSFGGSLGADKINKAVLGLIEYFYKTDKIHHIHACGKRSYIDFLKDMKAKNIDINNNLHIDIREYIHDMPLCYAACDLVICRAGAISISELQAAGKASILIPSPNVSENHQYHNAMVLKNKNAAYVIEEKNLTSNALCDIAENLINNKEEITTLSQNSKNMAVFDSNDRICSQIFCLVK